MIKDNKWPLDNWTDDAYLLRFCRARQFKLPKITSMFSKFIEYKIQNGIDDILDFEYQEAEVVMNEYARGFFGVDKIGRPIYIDKCGCCKVDKMMKLTTFDRLFKEVAKMWETMIKLKFTACSHLYDRQISQLIIIMDLSGFHMGLFTRQAIHLLKEWMMLCLLNYPEILAKFFFVNVPFVFAGAWAIIRGWLDEKLQKKVVMCGKDHMSRLLEYIDEDQIPTFIGGTNTSSFMDDKGPWDEYELIDSKKPGDTVGVRRKND